MTKRRQRRDPHRLGRSLPAARVRAGAHGPRWANVPLGMFQGRAPRGRVAPSANLTDGERIVPYGFENQQYLGNGAYAGFDGYQVWVLTYDG